MSYVYSEIRNTKYEIRNTTYDPPSPILCGAFNRNYKNYKHPLITL